MMNKILSCMAAVSMAVGKTMLASCGNNNCADLVVYGKIFTADNTKS